MVNYTHIDVLVYVHKVSLLMLWMEGRVDLLVLIRILLIIIHQVVCNIVGKSDRFIIRMFLRDMGDACMFVLDRAMDITLIKLASITITLLILQLVLGIIMRIG